MKLRLSSWFAPLGLLLPLATACTAGTDADDASNDDASAVTSDVRSRKKKSCAAVSGACVGISPSSCKNGVWADASRVSCGGGLGVGCCIGGVTCPTLSPPAPGFCPSGTIKAKKDENDCTVGYECVPPPSNECEAQGGQCVGLSPSSCTGGTWAPASTHSCGGGLGVGCCIGGVTCPMLSPPAPGFCPNGTIKAKKDANGCTVGYECVPPASNECEAKGGQCVGLTPASCPSGNWGNASTHSCGGGLGVGCCLD